MQTSDVRPTPPKVRHETILGRTDHVADDEVLTISAPFGPVPLEGVLGEQGCTPVADQLDDGDWRVPFVRH